VRGKPTLADQAPVHLARAGVDRRTLRVPVAEVHEVGREWGKLGVEEFCEIKSLSWR
jgi:hypothetical protein